MSLEHATERIAVVWEGITVDPFSLDKIKIDPKEFLSDQFPKDPASQLIHVLDFAI